MKLGDIEGIIKSKEDDLFRVTKKVQEKIESRTLQIELIISKLKTGDYEGIIKQEDNHYLIAISYDKTHDLLIAIRLDREYINIKTAFIQNKKRRITGKWK